MLADFYTKPLQGALFKKFRAVILGYEHVSSLQDRTVLSSLDEERVEESHPVEDEDTEKEPIESGGNERDWILVNRYAKSRTQTGRKGTTEGTGTEDAQRPTAWRRKYIKPQSEKYREDQEKIRVTFSQPYFETIPS